MDDLRNLWERGYTISELWGSPGPGTHKLASLAEENDAPYDAILDLTEHYQGYGQGEALALRYLKEGIWIAIGYKAPRSLDSKLIVIPPHLFDGLNLFTGDSSIAGSGLKFVGVHIIHNSLLTPPQSQAPLPRPPGRPSRAHHIEQAFESLNQEGLIDPDIPLNNHFALVRSRVHSLFPDEDQSPKGLGNPLLYRILAPLFEQVKMRKGGL